MHSVCSPLRAGSRAAILLASLLAILPAVAAAAPAAPTATRLAPADSLRFDPAVRTGTLPNGLRYYIRQNARPEARVALRLVVAAGSTAEADDQRGLAHFCEHMNFNGSAHFKPEELVAYLEAIGLRFAADANAYTSFDETVYKLDVPTDRDTLLDRGLLALSDFAGGATLSDSEFTKERGVVLEEWRLGRGAGERILRRQLPVMFHGSRYAERLPIGTPETIERAPVQRLRAFYRDWYTPDRMAVIAVGDVGVARMDSLVRVHFSALPRPKAWRAAPVPVIPLHQGTLFSIATDKEATGSRVSINYKYPRRPTFTAGGFREGLVERLFWSMLNQRFDEIAHRANAPFLSAGAGADELGRSCETWSLSASAADGGIETAFAALLAEESRLRQHGFLASELERARKAVRTGDERMFAERDKSESDLFAEEYTSSFLTGEPMAGIEAWHDLTSRFLDGITLDEVNALAGRLAHEDDRVVLASAPEKPGAPVPTEAALRALLANAGRTPVAAWQDTTAGRSLMPRLPQAGTVVARRTIEEIGVTVLTLSNGVQVWLKPTDFKADEVFFTAWAPGGLANVDSADVVAATLAPRIVSASGVGGFKGPEIQKLLAGRLVSVVPFSNAYLHGVTGNTRPADLETCLQLVYLMFTRPTEDPDAFAALKKRVVVSLTDRANSPEQVFRDTVTAVNTGGFYLDRAPTAGQVEAVELGHALDFARRDFANAADYAFFFAGSFQVDSIAPLLERYLASLPSRGKRTSALVARGPRRLSGVRTVQVRKGIEPKSQTVITFFSPGGLEELEMHRARACASILTDHLRQSLRELLGGTYSASAGFGTRLPLPGYNSMTIAFGCDPARADTLIVAALAEVRKLRAAGPSDADVQREQEVERRELEVGMKQNGFWAGALMISDELGWDPRRIAQRRERIEGLTPANLHEAFRACFPLDHYSVVTLLPQSAADAAGEAKAR